MLDQAHVGSDPIDAALSWIARRGIDIVPWDGVPVAPSLTSPGRPTLYVVAPGAPPPHPGPFEDWIRAPLVRDELLARADRLIDRARRFRPVPVTLDDDGLLTVGDALVILSPTEAAILALLLDHPGQIVARGAVTDRVWPDDPHGSTWLNKHVRNIRRRVEGLPLALHTVRGRGLLLEVLPAATDGRSR
jgi:two-component system response regulator PhoP/two-component system response regulator TctD